MAVILLATPNPPPYPANTARGWTYFLSPHRRNLNAPRTYPAWQAGIVYHPPTIVSFHQANWKCTALNTNRQPDQNPTVWKLLPPRVHIKKRKLHKDYFHFSKFRTDQLFTFKKLANYWQTEVRALAYNNWNQKASNHFRTNWEGDTRIYNAFDLFMYENLCLSTFNREWWAAGNDSEYITYPPPAFFSYIDGTIQDFQVTGTLQNGFTVTFSYPQLADFLPIFFDVILYISYKPTTTLTLNNPPLRNLLHKIARNDGQPGVNDPAALGPCTVSFAPPEYPLPAHLTDSTSYTVGLRVAFAPDGLPSPIALALIPAK